MRDRERRGNSGAPERDTEEVRGEEEDESVDESLILAHEDGLGEIVVVIGVESTGIPGNGGRCAAEEGACARSMEVHVN